MGLECFCRTAKGAGAFEGKELWTVSRVGSTDSPPPRTIAMSD